MKRRARVFPDHAEVPYGYCHCGCGQKAPVSLVTARMYGWKRGEPKKYSFGHAKTNPVDDITGKVSGAFQAISRQVREAKGSWWLCRCLKCGSETTLRLDAFKRVTLCMVCSPPMHQSMNPMWKGDDVGNDALHEWVKNHKPKPSRCECCGEVNTFLDLANISGDYHRDLSDWEYLCRRCHMTKDGRLEQLKLSSRGSRFGIVGREASL